MDAEYTHVAWLGVFEGLIWAIPDFVVYELFCSYISRAWILVNFRRVFKAEVGERDTGVQEKK